MRVLIAELLNRWYPNLKAVPGNICITNGATQALSLIFHVHDSILFTNILDACRAWYQSWLLHAFFSTLRESSKGLRRPSR